VLPFKEKETGLHEQSLGPRAGAREQSIQPQKRKEFALQVSNWLRL